MAASRFRPVPPIITSLPSFRDFFLSHLRGPLTLSERQKIEGIDIEASCKQLLAHSLQLEAVKTYRCSS